MEIMKYKNFDGSCEISTEDRLMYGKILFIQDLILYDGKDYDEVEAAFHLAVDEYLETCKLLGKEPNKPCSGTFNVRISPELHRELAIEALKQDTSINSCITRAVEEYLGKLNAYAAQNQAATNLMNASTKLCDSVSELHSYHKMNLSVVSQSTAFGHTQPVEIESSINWN